MDQRSGPRPIISEFATDPEMSELVQLFLSELPARITALESAWRERRVQNVSRIAHQLKGACSGYGFPDLGSAAAVLENRLRSMGESEAEAALENASGEFKVLIDLCARATRPAA